VKRYLRRLDVWDLVTVAGGGLVVYGVSLWSGPAAWVVAGVATAGLGYLGGVWASSQR
jgi:hypothetical protein